MSENATNTSYDLISLNGFTLPDVTAGKGTVTVIPNPKYTEHECEDGGKRLDVINDTMIMGNVSYSGLLQSELQTINAHLGLVSTMTIYNPLTGNEKTFVAKVVPDDVSKIIHDAVANAWTFGFSYEEIGSVTT